jgi:hypothetical protein
VAEVVPFTGITKLDMPAEIILQKAIEAGLTDVIIAGYDKDGELYIASSVADGGDALWLAELFKKRLLEIGDPKESD